MRENRYANEVRSSGAKKSKKDFSSQNFNFPVQIKIPKSRKCKNQKSKYYPNKNAKLAARVCLGVLLLIVVAVVIVCLVGM